MRYTVIITKDQQGNMSATAPGLPDCHAQAKTRREVIRRIQDNIAHIISQSEVIQVEVPAKPTAGNLAETPWEFFGAYPNDPAWGGFFEEIERQRETDNHC